MLYTLYEYRDKLILSLMRTYCTSSRAVVGMATWEEASEWHSVMESVEEVMGRVFP
jgi:hypothetical protein